MVEREAFLLFAAPSSSLSLFSFFIHLHFLWLKSATPCTQLLCCPPRCDGFRETCLSLTLGVGSTRMVYFMVYKNISESGDEDCTSEDVYPVSCWSILCIFLSFGQRGRKQNFAPYLVLWG